MMNSGRCAVLPNAGIRTHLLLSLFFAATTAVCARVSFPLWFTPVPVSLQVMAVILSGLVLGSRWGAISQIQYLAMGAMGLPVFTQMSAGPMAFAGPTGGYLFGFVFAAFAAGWVFERMNSRELGAWLGGIAGIAMIYLFGAAWLAVWMSVAGRESVTLHSVLAMGVVPFIGVDLLKTAAASALAHGGLKGLSLINSARR